MKLSRQFFDDLSDRFPSRTTTEVLGFPISAAALAAFTVAMLQAKPPLLSNEAIVHDLQIPLGLAYSGGASTDLDADMPTITQNIVGAQDKAKVAYRVRELVHDGYAAASGNVNAAQTANPFSLPRQGPPR